MQTIPYDLTDDSYTLYHGEAPPTSAELDEWDFAVEEKLLFEERHNLPHDRTDGTWPPFVPEAEIDEGTARQEEHDAYHAIDPEYEGWLYHQSRVVLAEAA